MFIQVTASEYVALLPALEAAKATHIAAIKEGAIASAKPLEGGQVAITHPNPDLPITVVTPDTNVNLDLLNGVSALQSLVTELAQARNAAESAASALKMAEARWLKTEGAELKSLKSATDKRATAVYDLVRALAPVISKATGESKPVMGVAVENFTAWMYDAGAALAWAVKRGAKAVALQLSPAQSPRLVTLLLDLIDYREKHAADLSPELAYLLNKIDSFLMLDAKEYEALLKSGMYSAEGIPGTQTVTPTATVDKDLSFHILETL